MVNCKCKVKTRNSVTQCERSSMVIIAYDYTNTTTNYSFYASADLLMDEWCWNRKM